MIKCISMACDSLSDMSLSTRGDIENLFLKMFSPVFSGVNDQFSNVLSGKCIPFYGRKASELETFSRLLWGLFPYISNNDQLSIENVFTHLAQCTDPDSPSYWGNITDFDQRSVETAAIAFSLAICHDKFKQNLSEPQLNNLFNWLIQIRDVAIPKNNWGFFAIMVEVSLCLNGRPWNKDIVAEKFRQIDSYYLGNGWYSDGENRPKDYYNAMAFHFYGLIYARLMAEEDPQRCRILKERAGLFAKDHVHFFAQDGAAIPYGRSLTYRFALASFWSAAAYAELEVLPYGMMKGMILRHLRAWLQHDIVDAKGILSVGYGYENMVMAEEYNAPGSPYWAFKVFIILALDAQHPFWQQRELGHPGTEAVHTVAEAGQIIVHNPTTNHHYLLNAGQLPAKNYNNGDSKYAKFCYSSLFGFNLERSRYNLELCACDSMLLLADGDGYYRGKRESQLIDIGKNGIVTRWKPWNDVDIHSYLIPLKSGHIRLHIVNSQRHLQCVEGGFPVPVVDERAFCQATSQEHYTLKNTQGLFCAIQDLSPAIHRHYRHVINPPGSNILYPQSSFVPILEGEIPKGLSILSCFVAAGDNDENIVWQQKIEIINNSILIKTNETKITINI